MIKPLEVEHEAESFETVLHETPEQTLFKSEITGEIREIDNDLVLSWKDAGNPKHLEWVPYNPPPAVQVVEERQPDWPSFKAEVRGNLALNQIFSEAFSKVPLSAGYMVLAFSKVEAQQGDEDFSVAWNEIRRVVEVPDEIVDWLTDRAAQNNLPETTISSLRGEIITTYPDH